LSSQKRKKGGETREEGRKERKKEGRKEGREGEKNKLRIKIPPLHNNT